MGTTLIKWDDGKVIHACESDYMVPNNRDTILVWTKCQRDVPANAGFYSREKVTCPKCLK